MVLSNPASPDDDPLLSRLNDEDEGCATSKKLGLRRY